MSIKTREVIKTQKRKHSKEEIFKNKEKKTNKAKYNREINSLKELWRDKKVQPIKEKKHIMRVRSAKKSQSNQNNKNSKVENSARSRVKSVINVETKRRAKSQKPPKTKDMLQKPTYISSPRELRHVKVDSEKERKPKEILKGPKAKRESKYNEKQKEQKRSLLSKRASSVVKTSKGIKPITKSDDKPIKSIVTTHKRNQSKRDKTARGREKSAKKDVIMKIDKKENMREKSKKKEKSVKKDKQSKSKVQLLAGKKRMHKHDNKGGNKRIK